MKILVIDDKAIHRHAAHAQLADHELTIVGTYDDAVYALSHWKAGEIVVGGFDVVLVDLMLPASRRTMGPEGMKFVGQEMPVGTFLVLLAMKLGIKYVGLLTDTNHHNHPASACIDDLFDIGRGIKPHDFGGSTVLCTSYPGLIKEDGSKDWHKLLEYLLPN